MQRGKGKVFQFFRHGKLKVKSVHGRRCTVNGLRPARTLKADQAYPSCSRGISATYHHGTQCLPLHTSNGLYVLCTKACKAMRLSQREQRTRETTFFPATGCLRCLTLNKSRTVGAICTNARKTCHSTGITCTTLSDCSTAASQLSLLS